MTSRFLAFLLLLFPMIPASAASPCSTIEFDREKYTVCTADPKEDDIRLFWKAADGKPYGGFSRLADELNAGHLVLRFAMNAGMYEQDLSPVGLYVEGGRKLHGPNVNKGPGNFHMLPNGVFHVGEKTAGVTETRRFLASAIPAHYATQSGPMLVIDGRLHPRFLADSTSAKLRNGVGVDRKGIAHFVISERPVTFHAFARLFRDGLDCPNALFLDGSISSLYTPERGRTGNPFAPIGPIVGVVVKKLQP